MVRFRYIALVLMLGGLVACAPKVQEIKSQPTIVYVQVPVNATPAKVGPRPLLKIKSITNKSSNSDVLTAYRTDLMAVEVYALQVECALAPFQKAAGQKPSAPDASCVGK